MTDPWATDGFRPTRVGAPRFGVVDVFDEERGIGQIVADDGSRVPFHCTAIADGSRRVAVGAAVLFVPAAGHGGSVEARHVEAVTRPGPSSP